MCAAQSLIRHCQQTYIHPSPAFLRSSDARVGLGGDGLGVCSRGPCPTKPAREHRTSARLQPLPPSRMLTDRYRPTLTIITIQTAFPLCRGEPYCPRSLRFMAPFGWARVSVSETVMTTIMAKRFRATPCETRTEWGVGGGGSNEGRMGSHTFWCVRPQRLLRQPCITVVSGDCKVAGESHFKSIRASKTCLGLSSRCVHSGQG